ncbi:LOW QUALITY PROTEIN: FACT complex subunit Spt16 domain [Dillenia turbinata]|uniref:FACT complex subunit n=1 Tax=Dillenia turbinata TaxID=194707 RepID=A0AAN8YVZ3_9MAGN
MKKLQGGLQVVALAWGKTRGLGIQLNVNDLPPPRDLMIQTYQKNEAVLLPIYAWFLSIVSSQQDTNGTCYIRIIFNVPGAPFSPHDTNSMEFPGYIYFKEVSFHSKDPRHISEVRATLFTQEKLQLAVAKFKPTRLSNLWIHPSFCGCGRTLIGTLEARTNGFRYSTARPDERVDIMYGNIKHAFFQPTENEMITLLHFHLHGNKQNKDVQFYVEVMDVVRTLGGGRRSAYDLDETEE